MTSGTLTQLSGPITTRVEQAPNVAFLREPRYSAYLTFGDVATDRHCTHLHARPDLAEKCRNRTEKAAEFWVGATVSEVSPGLYEARQGSTTCRFRVQ